jgi:hypothetical protein
MNLSDKIAVIFGVLSALLWMFSAMVNIPVGKVINDHDWLARQLKKVSWLNVGAAACSAVSVIAANATNLSKWIC